MLIYLIENIVNGKIYIGQTIRSLKKRIAEHKSDAQNHKKKQCPYLHAAIRKYGWNNFKFHILDTAKSQEELDTMEVCWIDIFQSRNRNIGYNLEKGGRGTGRMSDETKLKISLSLIGTKPSIETRLKLSQSKRGENHPHARLTKDIVKQIRYDHEVNKMTCRSIEMKYGIVHSSASRILSYKAWKI